MSDAWYLGCVPLGILAGECGGTSRTCWDGGDAGTLGTGPSRFTRCTFGGGCVCCGINLGFLGAAEASTDA